MSLNKKKHLTISKILYGLFALLIVIDIIFADMLNGLKTIIWLILLIGIVCGGKIIINRTYIVLIVYTLFSIIFMIYGYFRGWQGAFSNYTTQIIYPIFLSVVFFYYCTIDNMENVFRLLIIIGTMVAAYDSLFILSNLLSLPIPQFFWLKGFNFVYGHHGWTQISSPHLACLVFITPMYSAYMLSNINRVKRGGLIVAFVVQLLAVLLTGRFAILLLTLMSPLLFVIMRVFVNNKNIINVIDIKMILKILMILVILALVLFLINESGLTIFEELIDKIKEHSLASENTVRGFQRKQLFELFKESPLIGWGDGAEFQYSFFSPERTISAESVYHVLLYHRGIIGLLGQFLLFYYIFIRIKKSIKRNQKLEEIGIALMVGFLSAIIGNSVDPYLGSFSWMWMTYIPCAFGEIASSSANSIYIEY